MTNINAILDAARTHCDEVIKPNIAQWNDAGVWPRDASDKAAAAGLTGLYCAPEFGGQGLAFGEAIQVYEALGKGDGAYSFALSMHNICAFAVCNFATEAFREAWARDLTAGRKLANFALTEPQSGSDAMKMYTRARLDDAGNYIINGAKAWVSLAQEADVYLVVVKTSEAPGHKDMAMVAVPVTAEGLSFGPRYDTPSYRFLPMSEMYFENVKVPAENVIAPAGQGMQTALAAIDIARVSIAAGCCGLMETALDTALAYAKNRKMFDGVNLDLDGTLWPLGNIATDLEMSRLLYRKAAAAIGTKEGPLLAAHAKLYVPDAALRAATICTQILGGMGLLKPYGLDRLTLLAQMLKIVDGTTEIQRVVIGRALRKRAESLADIPVPKGYGEA